MTNPQTHTQTQTARQYANLCLEVYQRAAAQCLSDQEKRLLAGIAHRNYQDAEWRQKTLREFGQALGQTLAFDPFGPKEALWAAYVLKKAQDFAELKQSQG